MSYSLCTNSLEDYANPDCEENFGGGIRSMIVFQTQLPADPSSQADVQALIDSGDAKLLTSLKVGVSEPSPVENTSMRSCSPPSVTTYERELTLIDANVVPGNVDFYNSLNASTGFEAAGVMLWHCDADRISFVDKPINFKGGLLIPDDNNAEPQHFSFTGAWKDKGDPQIYESPAGIFSE